MPPQYDAFSGFSGQPDSVHVLLDPGIRGVCVFDGVSAEQARLALDQIVLCLDGVRDINAAVPDAVFISTLTILRLAEPVVYLSLRDKIFISQKDALKKIQSQLEDNFEDAKDLTQVVNELLQIKRLEDIYCFSHSATALGTVRGGELKLSAAGANLTIKFTSTNANTLYRESQRKALSNAAREIAEELRELLCLHSPIYAEIEYAGDVWRPEHLDRAVQSKDFTTDEYPIF